MLPKVFIETEPLLIMIWAAIEEFKKEALGLILGYLPTPKNPNFYVTAAFPLQSVKRGLKGKAFSEVEPTNSGHKRFGEFEKWLSTGRILKIGDFHSHTEYRGLIPPDELSNRDKNFMEEGQIGILISITSRKKRKLPWEALSDGRISGSFGKYNFIFGAYMLKKKDDSKIDKNAEDDKKVADLLEIVTPTAIKALNRMQQKH